MSLKAFHLFFIAASIALCGWVANWGVQSYRATQAGDDLALGAVCAVLGFVLIVYGLKVYRKFRELGR